MQNQTLSQNLVASLKGLGIDRLVMCEVMQKAIEAEQAMLDVRKDTNTIGLEDILHKEYEITTMKKFLNHIDPLGDPIDGSSAQ